MTESYVVLSNLAGGQNLGNFLRTASAFSVAQVIVVGSDRFATHGAHQAHKFVEVVQVSTYEEARKFLTDRACTIYGVHKASTPHATSIHDVTFTSSSAFVLPNEGGELTAAQSSVCDAFVHIGSANPPTASDVPLGLNTVLGITLYTFTSWSKPVERKFKVTSTQGKFVVDEIPTQMALKDTQAARDKAVARESRRQEAEDSVNEDLSSIFD